MWWGTATAEAACALGTVDPENFGKWLLSLVLASKVDLQCGKYSCGASSALSKFVYLYPTIQPILWTDF